jgi:hypothetical protein
MDKSNQRLEVLLEILSLSDTTDIQLAAGGGVNVYHEGNYFPGRILECPRPLRPGDSGQAVIGILGDPGYPLNFTEGTEFELRDGPVKKVASAKVLRVLEIRDSY